jgi:hypothetical protein
MVMLQMAQYLYINVHVHKPDSALDTYQCLLDQPLTIRKNCRAEILQLYFTHADKRNKAFTSSMHLTGGARDVIIDRQRPMLPNFACLIPSAGTVHKDIQLMPFGAGTYDCLNISFRDMKGDIIEFSSLVMTLKFYSNE